MAGIMVLHIALLSALILLPIALVAMRVWYFLRDRAYRKR